ncbi:MAG: DUF4432 family protein [Actinobacteria bacterium]|nr:DUF4432 family protein [Actinomycetota bacterium]
MISQRRNYGCRINDELLYKGLKTVVMENEILRLSILVGKGTDILELLYKPEDIDFMWSAPCDFKEGELNRKDFLESYLGGWQEIVPNGGPGCVYRGAVFEQHGETPQLCWDHEIIEDSPGKISVRFSTRLKKLSLEIEKIITMVSNSPVVTLKEKLLNTGKETVDFMWGHHPCFGEPFLSEDCIINFKAGEIVSNIEPISGNPFVAANAKGTLKEFPGLDGSKVDLSRVPGRDARVCDLLYVTELLENWFSILNIKKRTGIGFVFDPSVFRYLWLWLSYGGSNGYPWYGKTYNLAIEPWSSWPGRGLLEAIKNKTSLEIKPGEELNSWLKVVVFKKDREVTKINDNCKVM